MSIPEKKGTLLSFSVLCPDNTSELRQLMSRNISLVIAESNGHVTQEALPLPATLEPKTEPIRITIKGQPIGKPRMTDADRWKKRPCVMRYWAWCDRAREARGDKLKGADIEGVIIRAFFAMPDSWSHSKKLQMDGKKHFDTPDYDNVAKACGDALMDNDEILADAFIQKRWTLGEPRVEVIFVKEDLCLNNFLK
jgi:Holliday junction resolvase RusA-like endonuclease